MATLTIRRLDEPTKRQLRLRAAEHGVSMEEEARKILMGALLHRLDPPNAEQPPAVEFDADGNPKGWRLKASFAEIMSLSAKPPVPFDQKAVTDELYSYLEEE